MAPPYIHSINGTKELMVDGKPFLMLAAELQNSSMSSARYMEDVWPRLKDMNVNTVLGSVSWEQIEPEESRFDFSTLDEIIASARKYELHLVLLWFGSYKNGMSSYVPAWVKKDAQRFPRSEIYIKDENGALKLKTIEVLSPFHANSVNADAKAFATLMEHLKVVDKDIGTVLMVQVENEVGLLGDTRDRSSIAEAHFIEQVSGDLINKLAELDRLGKLHPLFKKRFQNFHKSIEQMDRGDWNDIFGSGDEADELFMADAFSSYVNQIAKAGKKAYDIPMYTNAWLNFEDSSELDISGFSQSTAGGGGKPGEYPSGGPVPHTLDVWMANADCLEFFSPDIYLQDYETMCKRYSHGRNTLFIPEQRRDEKGARRIWLAYGSYRCLGCSPFGIDTLETHEGHWKKHYGLLSAVSNQILEARRERPWDMMGFFFDEPTEETRDQVWTHSFGEFKVLIERAFVFGKKGPAFGLVIHKGSGNFLCIGFGYQISFQSTDPKSRFCGILSAKEQCRNQAGDLVTGRWLGGDETRSGRALIMPAETPDYGGYPIAITVPAGSGIAEVTAYSI
jgi:hypothetical protein